MACRFCGNTDVMSHTCNSYCIDARHAQVDWTAAELPDLATALAYRRQAQRVQACCIDAEAIQIESIREAPEAPDPVVYFAGTYWEQWARNQRDVLHAYLVMFTYSER